MQSESQALSTTAVTENTPRTPTSTSQHGIHDYDGSPEGNPSPTDDVGAESPISAEQLALDAALAASLQDIGAAASSENRGLNIRDTPSPPAYNRIVEYEQAATPSARKKDEGPVFEVVKKARSPNDKRSPIQDLPNGKLGVPRTDNRPSLT